MLIAAAGAFLLAGFVKGVIGLGLPTVAIGLLGLLMTPTQAAAILVLPALITNVWQAAVGGNLVPLVKRAWPMLVGVCIGTVHRRDAACRAVSRRPSGSVWRC